MAIDLKVVDCFIRALDATRRQKGEVRIFASKDVLRMVWQQLMETAKEKGDKRILTNDEIEEMLETDNEFDFGGVIVELCSGERKCFASVNYCGGIKNAVKG